MTILTVSSPVRRKRRVSPLTWLLGLASLGRQRRRLAELDDHLLKDIGLSREAAREEANRPIWDAPDHWLK